MFAAEITGDREVLRVFPRVEATLRAELVTGIGRIALRLQARVMRDKLTGQVLNVRTGRLRRSITRRVTESAGMVQGLVGTNVEYARVHEYGDNRVVSVRDHLRRVKKAFGKPLAKPRKVRVQGHARRQKVPERSFLRSALRDIDAAGVIDRELSAAVVRALRRL